MTIIALALALTLVLVLWRPGIGFAGQQPEHYAATGPAFDLRRHLDGPLVSEGMIYDLRGRVISRFVAEMEGKWSGAAGTLAEHFVYAGNGGRQDREWSLQVLDDGHFEATAPDIVGRARGRQCGATVWMQYRIRLPKDAGGHVLAVTDWMYLMENGSIMNRSQMRKFGLPVAELIATIRPRAA